MMPRRRPIRRALALLAVNLVLGALTLAIVGGYTDGLEAARDRLSRQLRHLNSERSMSEGDQAFLEANQDAYQALVAGGLLEPPDRLAVAALLDHLQAAHGLNAIRYSFSPQIERPLGPQGGGRLAVIATDVAIDMVGISDTDMLGFAAAVESGFPGDIRVTELRLYRRERVDDALLGRLRAGEPIDLVEGRLAFEWRTLQWRDPAATEDGP